MIDETDYNLWRIAVDQKIGLIWPPVPPPPPPMTFDLQGAINAAPAGSTLHIPGGTAKQTIGLGKPLKIIFDAPFLLDATGLGVQIQQGGAFFIGAGASGSSLIGPLRITGSGGAAFSASAELPPGGGYALTDLWLEGLELDHNIQYGYALAGVQRLTFKNCLVHHNNLAKTVDPTNMAGGGKTWLCDAVTHDGGMYYNNVGPGIWFDGTGATHCVVRNVKAFSNTLTGILLEICSSGLVENNLVWDNGWGQTGWCSGIMCESASGVEVRGNLLAWNARGLAVHEAIRSDKPSPVKNISLHDNIVVMGPKSDYAAYWLDETVASPANNGGFFAPSANNSGANNRFAWSVAGTVGYYWNNQALSLAAFAATPAGKGSALLTNSA